MAAGEVLKLIVSYGREIQRCPVSGKLRYIGGENRLVKICLSDRLAGLRARLAALAGYSDSGSDMRIRYAIVEEGLDALHDVDSDADLWRLLTLLYYRAAGVAAKDCRVRAFLLPDAAAVSSNKSPPAHDYQAPPRVGPCLQHSASSPAFLPATADMGHHDVDVEATLLKVQSDAAANMAASLDRADSGLEALAAIAAEQQKQNLSSVTIQRADDSGLQVAATPAAEQKLAPCPPPVFLVPVAPIVAVFYFYTPVIPVRVHVSPSRRAAAVAATRA